MGAEVPAGDAVEGQTGRQSRQMGKGAEEQEGLRKDVCSCEESRQQAMAFHGDTEGARSQGADDMEIIYTQGMLGRQASVK